MRTEVVCEEARILRGRRARRPRSPQGASRNTGEGVELPSPWDSEVQAHLTWTSRSGGPQRASGVHMRSSWDWFLPVLLGPLPYSVISPSETLKVLTHHSPSEHWSCSHLYLCAFFFVVYLLCKTVSFWKVKAWV